MTEVHEICGSLARAEERVRQHMERINKENQELNQVMALVQQCFGDQQAGQQAVTALFQALNQCAMADSALHRVCNELRGITSRLKG